METSVCFVIVPFYLSSSSAIASSLSMFVYARMYQSWATKYAAFQIALTVHLKEINI